MQNGPWVDVLPRNLTWIWWHGKGISFRHLGYFEHFILMSSEDFGIKKGWCLRPIAASWQQEIHPEIGIIKPRQNQGKNWMWSLHKWYRAAKFLGILTVCYHPVTRTVRKIRQIWALNFLYLNGGVFIRGDSLPEKPKLLCTDQKEKKHTSQKTNIEPENHPLKRKKSSSKLPFCGCSH